jgi:NAD(P)-dependent dehydrogenase (short-subunit alcohol dehydrogenase family)
MLRLKANWWRRPTARWRTGVGYCNQPDFGIRVHGSRKSRKNGGGGIVNTASVAGLQGLPTAPAYVGAKHGVAGLTKTVAPEFAQRAIRSTRYVRDSSARRWSIAASTGAHSAWSRSSRPSPCVGWAAGRNLRSSAVLCSDASSFVTGRPMPVDGGHVAQ